MSKPKGKIVVEFELRDPDYLSDKYIKEFQKNIPFDMELVSLTNCKKVAVHRFVVMMFSKHIRNLFIDGGNSFKNGHVISKYFKRFIFPIFNREFNGIRSNFNLVHQTVPVNVPYHILIKVIELFYDCRTTIPAHSVSDMNKALHILQVYNVMDFVGQMAPPIIIPNSGVRPMPVNVEPQLNRRQTMAYQPIMDPKRRCTNIVPTPQPMVRPLVAPIKVQPLTFEQVRLTPNMYVV